MDIRRFYFQMFLFFMLLVFLGGTVLQAVAADDFTDTPDRTYEVIDV